MDRGETFDRRPLALVALASGLILAWRAVPVAALRDPIAGWPWPGGDTWDFVVSGLVLRGVPLDTGSRPPLLPLLVALGDATGLLGLVPLLGLVAACAAPVLLAREVAARTGGFGASGAALALLLSQYWLRYGLEWMADVPAAGLFALAAAELGPAKGSPRWIRAGILGGLSVTASQLALLLVPLTLGAVALARPRGAEARRAGLGIALLTAPAVAWFLTKTTLFGARGDLGVQHWRFLGLHADGLAPFLWQVLSAWGWPGSLAALAGLVVLGRRARARPLELVPVATVLTVAIFWGVVYGYHAPRFAATLLPLLVLPTALGLAAIPRRMLRVAAACAVVLATAWPLPGFVAHGITLPLVPFPTLVVRVPLAASRADGSVTPQLASARVAHEAARVEDLAWVAARRPAPPPTTLVAGAFEGIVGVLLVDTAPERRFERTKHLAALVRVPAVRAPRLAVEVLPLGRPRPLGARGPFAFARVESPLDGRDWILAIPAAEDPPRLRGGPRDAAELERARAVAGRRAGRHVVAVVEPGASWWAWLCLLVPGEWLHYSVPEDREGLERFLATVSRPAPSEELHGLSIVPVETLGRVGIVVRAAPSR